MGSYTDAGIQDLKERAEEARAIRDRIFAFLYPLELKNVRARKFLEQGVLRRTSLIARSIQEVFHLLPPETSRIPKKDTLDLVTIQLQSSITNTYGLLDCWAHVWANEFAVCDKAGKLLPAIKVGLGPKYATMRSSLTPELREYLDSRDEWIKNLTRSRDSLAHRIPLYIPPHMVDPANAEKYREKLVEWHNSLDAGARHALDQEMIDLAHFKAIMIDDPENDPGVFIHPQLIANFLTIEELSNAFAFGIYERKKEPSLQQ